MPTLLQKDDSTAGQAPLNTDPRTPGQGIEAPPPNLSILPAGLSDAPAEKDSLGFGYYVSAIKEFLVSPYTKAPLTLSIEGPWGSGKSSFMIQLRNQIAPELEGSPKRDQRRKRQAGSPPIVEFNAWRHDKQEALWAAFALSFIEQISTQCSFWKRVSGLIRLFWSRFDRRGGWLPAARALTITITLIACSFAIPILMFTRGLDWATNVASSLSQYPSAKNHGGTSKKEKGQESKELSTGQAEKENNLSDRSSNKQSPPGSEAAFNALKPIINAGGLTGSVTLFLYLLYSVARILGNPFEINLRKHVRSPDYEGSIAFIENFQRDFNKVLDAYVGKLKPDLTDEQLNKLKTFVFIDDLDRCELPKAAELMNAINLLISGDQRLIFVIGMDRQKVAAAVASKYQELVPFLQNEAQYTKEDSPQVKQPIQAIAFGYSFLEKFIQLPFSVPAPNRLDDFLESISQDVKSRDDKNVTASGATVGPERERLSSARRVDPNSPKSGEAPGPGGGKAKTEEERQEFVLGLERDSDSIRQTAKWVGRIFDYNPRRLKQFINLFKLRIYIADYAGLLDTVGDKLPELTPGQIAKLTAIFLRWPNFAEAWLRTPTLLQKLQEEALKSPSPASDKTGWEANQDLITLLRIDPTADGSVDESGHIVLNPEFTLGQVKLESVLRVMPVRIRSTLGAAQQAARHSLNQLAREYMETRRSMPASPKRTVKMNEIFKEMVKAQSAASLPDAAIRRLFDQSEGDRIAGLAAISIKRGTRYSDLIFSCIADLKSAFEQYHALVNAEAMLNDLKPDQRIQLDEALSKAIGTTITPGDPSRWDLAQSILLELRKVANGPPASDWPQQPAARPPD